MSDPKSTLSRGDYQQLQTLFEEIVDTPEPDRSTRIDEACLAYPQLETRLKLLLQYDDGQDDSSDLPTLRSTSTLTEDAGWRQVAGYEILEEIGRGGMGVVYRARQYSPDRVVALKMIRVGRFATEEDVRRFSNEVDAIAKLAHDGIVPIYEIGCHHGEHFYSMQLIEGMPFDHYLASAEFDESEALAIFAQVCEAVAFCHERGVIHRDLKPSNVLLDKHRTPKLTDFGLAKHLERESDLTRTGEVMGTPGYMAPEQADDTAAVVNERADVYSLGAILYRIVTGRPPINTTDVNIVGAIQLVTDNDIVAPRLLKRGVAGDLETICLKCLEGDATKRYRDAGEVAKDIRRHLDGEPILARPLTPPRRMIRWARQQPGLAVTWYTVSIFYLYHLIYVYKLSPPPIDTMFHGVATLVAIIWAAGAYVFQRRMLHGTGNVINLFGWVTMDVLLVNLLLVFARGGASPLTVILLVLVAASALRFRTDLVLYVTVLCFLSYLFHAIRSAGEIVSRSTLSANDLMDDSIVVNEMELNWLWLNETVPFALAILSVGAVQYFALRRSRAAAQMALRR